MVELNQFDLQAPFGRRGRVGGWCQPYMSSGGCIDGQLTVFELIWEVFYRHNCIEDG